MLTPSVWALCDVTQLCCVVVWKWSLCFTVVIITQSQVADTLTYLKVVVHLSLLTQWKETHISPPISRIYLFLCKRERGIKWETGSEWALANGQCKEYPVSAICLNTLSIRSISLFLVACPLAQVLQINNIKCVCEHCILSIWVGLKQ